MASKVLFVDDEKGILSSLNRLFMDDELDIYTAISGLEALEILKKETMDVIVSDQRMPEMSGVEFLKNSKVYSPDSVRMILTGYADIESAINSINEGEVYRYIAKPWNSNELKATIMSALEFGRLRKENVRLLELTQKQNLELKEFYSGLEVKVKEQTEDISRMLDESRLLYKKLNKSFFTSIKVFINMMRLRNESLSAHMKDTARLSKTIAQKMKLSEQEIRCVEIAALLHDIGKMGIADSILNKSFGELSTLEKTEYMKHPILGQAALQSIESMKNIGVIVRCHHEEWNGHGFPGKLSGDKIPMGSRIIAVASDYDELLKGKLVPSKFTELQAKEFILKNSNQRYDPDVVVIFVAILTNTLNDSEEMVGLKVLSVDLKCDMILASDLFTSNGFLILSEGTKLTQTHISSIVDFEKAEKKKYEIFVAPE